MYPRRYLLTYPNTDILGQLLDFKIIQNGDCEMLPSLDDDDDDDDDDELFLWYV